MGPSLAAFGITDALLDPVLELRDSDGSLISSNDNWKDTQRSQIEGTVFQPNDDRESVIVATLMPANYTAILLGKNNTAGIGLIEVYDNNQAVEPELANISVGCGHGPAPISRREEKSLVVKRHRPEASFYFAIMKKIALTLLVACLCLEPGCSRPTADTSLAAASPTPSPVTKEERRHERATAQLPSQLVDPKEEEPAVQPPSPSPVSPAPR
jgi:hypothetical protein